MSAQRSGRQTEERTHFNLYGKIEPQRCYIVAATPRTGSSLLCECLEATGIAGRPAEVFAPDFRDQWRAYLSVPAGAGFDEYLRVAFRYGTTPNGIRALKIQWMHVATLAGECCFTADSDDVLEALYPGAAYVNIRRRDRRAQALSLYRAYATNDWWRFRGDWRIPKRPPLDRERVRQLEQEIEGQQSSWERYFCARGITALTVEYENLAFDYRAETSRVLSFLGLDAAAGRSIPEPRLVRQSDDLNLSWRSQIEQKAPLPGCT